MTVNMPALQTYKLGDLENLDPPGIRIGDLSLLEITSSLCMLGLSYEINFNGMPVSYTSMPAQLVKNTIDELEIAVYTDDIEYLGFSVLTVRALLPYIDTAEFLNRRMLSDDQPR